MSIVKPGDLHKIADDIELTKVREALARKRHMEEEESSLRQEFMNRDLRPDVHERVNSALRKAAEHGLTEIKVVEFPASYCTDRGRAINNFEPTWPETLQGWARRAYDYYEQELRPAGYKLRAQITSYNEGMPGTVAIYLSW